MEFRFADMDLSSLERRDCKSFYHVAYRLCPSAALFAFVIRLLTGMGAALMFFMTVGILVSEESSPWSAVGSAVLCLVNLLIAVGYQRIVIWRSKKHLLSPGEKTSVTINDSGITDQTGGITTRYDFGSFYAVCYCRDVYLLFVNKRTALILPERYREGGSSAELKKFLEEKTQKPIRYFK